MTGEEKVNRKSRASLARLRVGSICTAAILAAGGLALAAALGFGVGTTLGIMLCAAAVFVPAVRLSLMTQADGPGFGMPLADALLLTAAITMGFPAAALPGALVGAGALLFCKAEAIDLGQAIVTILKPAALAASAAFIYRLTGGSLIDPAHSILPAAAAAAALALIRLAMATRREAASLARLVGRTVTALALAYPTAVCMRIVPASLIIPAAAIITIILILRRKPYSEQSAQAIAPMSRESGTTQEISLVDQLTGLANRRYMTMFLGQEISRSSRSLRPLSVLLMDIDGLERVNASSGREAGDALLKQVAWHLKRLVREYDVVARYAGDEFIIILPETDAMEALEIASRIHEFLVNQPDAKTTVTIGVATHPQHGNSAEDLLSSAHHALNRAKFAGKNTVLSCHTLAQAG